MDRPEFQRRSVLGTLVAIADYGSASEAIMARARAREPYTAAAEAVHPVALAWVDRTFGSVLNSIDLVVPDGQPVRWALNRIHGANLNDRVYGPTLTLHLCEQAAADGIGLYLYGSTPVGLVRLEENLKIRFPGLRIAGAYAPPFRVPSDEEDAVICGKIRESRAGLVLVGLGCPKQEFWVESHRDRIGVPLVAVGAAFDFHSGMKPQAPSWMQRRGLEWVFRLWNEPRRLWFRYLYYNSLFVILVALQFMGMRFRPHPRR